MKYLLFLFTFSSFVSAGQPIDDSSFPFHVLYAENCKNSRGQSLKSLDTVAIDDIITIGEKGTLSLVHLTGFPIELNNDTTIHVRSLQRLFAPPSSDTRKKKQGVVSRFSIDIGYLFISDMSQAKRKKLSMIGVCHDCGSDFEIVYPPSFPLSGQKSTVYFKKELCLKWCSQGSKNFKVEIWNVPGDLLKTYTTNTNSLSIDSLEVNHLMKMATNKALIIKITDVDSKLSSKERLLIEFPDDQLEFPFFCTLQNATLALMTGYYIETTTQGYDEAHEFYSLATTLSDKPFYKEMLDNFKKRHKK